MNALAADAGTQVPDRSGAPCSRPRVEGDREQEILQGALEVLVDVGYDRLTFDAVAAHVRASKATLYRRWSTKAELVVAAVDAQTCEGPLELAVPDTGSLESDLLEFFGCEQEMSDQLAAVIAATMPALSRDPELMTAFKEKFMAPRVQRLRTMMERAQQRGQIAADADLDLLLAIVPALKFHDLVMLGQPPTMARMRAIVQRIVLPACAAGLPTRSPTPVGGRT